ncbi:Bin3-domain-containing protein [Wallemia mellicola]|uniref:RNA methyltransferase n=1 Tax=Wallemia mellicola TaxID=1708541 RepID=A0AB38MU02_9BASI|nr:Bin3-domain-containing protein [Wallemia mellicola]TIC63714.1 Bin3-domain-containing protein [Wallemia mellicola]
MTAPIHGNYKNYYSKRQNTVNGTDARIDALGSDFCDKLRDKDILDVGCNEGKITIEIARKFSPKFILGVDLDPALIHRATKELKVVWSTSKPIEGNEKGKRKRKDDTEVAETGYFPLSMPSMFGFLPFPESSTSFPCNIEFKKLDVMQGKLETNGYDVILALSITKWIHLNGGDDGLILFFKKLYEALKEGGELVLEAQPVKSYQNAVSDMHQLKPTFEKLTIDPSQFEALLVNEIGFREVRHCIEESQCTPSSMIIFMQIGNYR